MLKYGVVTILLAIAGNVFAQRELIHAADPASLRSETVSITHFNVPEEYALYAGIRFIDMRYIQSFSGFIQQNAKTGFRKIATEKPFDEALNSAIKIKKDSSVLRDSVVIVFKNFWMWRPAIKAEEMNCHIKALFFTKRGDSFFFRGKMDSVFNRHAIIAYEYKDLPALFVEDLLNAFSLRRHTAGKLYLQDDFFKQAYAAKQNPADSINENGVFLSFGDFLKTKIYHAGFSLSPVYEQYRLVFDSEQDNKNAGKIWGCWYNGELYIKNGKYYSKAFAAEGSFLVMDIPVSRSEENKYSTPMVLNMETGRLE